MQLCHAALSSFGTTFCERDNLRPCLFVPERRMVVHQLEDERRLWVLCLVERVEQIDGGLETLVGEIDRLFFLPDDFVEENGVMQDQPEVRGIRLPEFRRRTLITKS
jgi:hypothetical protein